MSLHANIYLQHSTFTKPNKLTKDFGGVITKNSGHDNIWDHDRLMRLGCETLRWTWR